MAASTSETPWAPSKRHAWQRWLVPTAQGLTGFVVLALFLEFLSRSGLIAAHVLPPMTVVLRELVLLPQDAEFVGELVVTLQATFLGLGLSFLVGAGLGLILGSSELLYRASISLIEFLRPLPGVALIPVAILFFGVGMQMKLVLVLAAATWPILFNTIYGVRGVHPTAIDTARSFGMGRLRIALSVELPHALPFIYTGLRIAVSTAVLVVISVELLTGATGLGSWLLVVGGERVRTDLLYAGLIVAGFLGWGLNWLLVIGERRFFAWKLTQHGN